MAMENTLLIGGGPIETPISSGFPIATFDYRKVLILTIPQSSYINPYSHIDTESLKKKSSLWPVGRGPHDRSSCPGNDPCERCDTFRFLCPGWGRKKKHSKIMRFFLMFYGIKPTI